MPDGEVYYVDDENEPKYDLIAAGERPGVVWRVERKRSKAGNNMLVVHYRVQSEHPDLHNTEIRRYYVHNKVGVNIAKKHLRAVLGDDVIAHGEGIVLSRFEELFNELQWESWPNVDEAAGAERRPMLLGVGVEDSEGYGLQNKVNWLGPLRDSYEEAPMAEPPDRTPTRPDAAKPSYRDEEPF